MAFPTYYKNFTGNDGAGFRTAITPEKKVLEDLILTCQRLDDYLNSSPTEPPCFLTRKVIAEADIHSPIYSMAESLPVDPKEIKNNVNKVITPVLNCLRRFIEIYGRPDSDMEGFDSAVATLYPLIKGAHSYVQ